MPPRRWDCADALARFEHLLGRLTDEEAQRATHGKLEALTQAEGNEFLRRLIQGYFDQSNLENVTYKDVVLVQGDGGFGCPPLQRYKQIAITAACKEIPEQLLAQLTIKGRLIAPAKTSH